MGGAPASTCRSTALGAVVVRARGSHPDSPVPGNAPRRMPRMTTRSYSCHARVHAAYSHARKPLSFCTLNVRIALYTLAFTPFSYPRMVSMDMTPSTTLEMVWGSGIWSKLDGSRSGRSSMDARGRPTGRSSATSPPLGAVWGMPARASGDGAAGVVASATAVAGGALAPAALAAVAAALAAAAVLFVAWGAVVRALAEPGAAAPAAAVCSRSTAAVVVLALAAGAARAGAVVVVVLGAPVLGAAGCTGAVRPRGERCSVAASLPLGAAGLGCADVSAAYVTAFLEGGVRWWSWAAAPSDTAPGVPAATRRLGRLLGRSPPSAGGAMGAGRLLPVALPLGLGLVSVT
mmetsp:Transcript_512/g.1355  ORF Transcript_512/g.1355 Transcript_512/m.1355 type:complete len:347 (+) Transcript_512:2540-3580(+)